MAPRRRVLSSREGGTAVLPKGVEVQAQEALRVALLCRHGLEQFVELTAGVEGASTLAGERAGQAGGQRE